MFERYRAAESYRALARAVALYRDGIPELLDKDAIRGRSEELIHPAARGHGLALARTSGSTGQPLQYFESDLDTAATSACYNRLYQLLPRRSYTALTIRDLHSSDPVGAPPFHIAGGATPEERFDLAFRQLSSRLDCDLLAQRVWDEQPGLLEGYPSIIHLIARVLVSQQRAVTSVEVISPCGELCDARDREVFRQAFPRASIYNRYGSLELGSLAWECPLCTRYHFNSDYFAFQILPDQSLIVSKRFPSACQLVHYAIGDKVRFVGLGACRVELPSIELLAGRRDHLLYDRTRQPRRILIFYNLQEVAGLMQWQLVQRADLSLVLSAVVERESAKMQSALQKALAADLGDKAPPMEVRFARALNASSKGVRVVSEVDAAALSGDRSGCPDMPES